MNPNTDHHTVDTSSEPYCAPVVDELPTGCSMEYSENILLLDTQWWPPDTCQFALDLAPLETDFEPKPASSDKSIVVESDNLESLSGPVFGSKRSI